MKSKLIYVMLISFFFLTCEKGWLKKIIYPPGCTDDTACNYNPDAPKDDDSCLYLDCAHECGGQALEDICDICDDNPSNDGVFDNCGVCDNDSENDCNGVLGGSAIEDCAGVCGGITQSEDCYVTDIDGNVYQNVQIGNQLWMSENLKTAHYQNGDPIQYVQSESSEPNVWENLNTGAYGYSDDNLFHQETYGNLYSWYAVDDDRGVCPESWHVPTDDEYKELEMFLGMSQSEADDTISRGTNEGSKLAGNTSLWINGNLENNAEFGISGFNGFPGGYRTNDNGGYYGMGNTGYFWSSNEDNSNGAWYRALGSTNSGVYRYDANKKYGFSVRCVRD